MILAHGSAEPIAADIATLRAEREERKRDHLLQTLASLSGLSDDQALRNTLERIEELQATVKDGRKERNTLSGKLGEPRQRLRMGHAAALGVSEVDMDVIANSACQLTELPHSPPKLRKEIAQITAVLLDQVDRATGATIGDVAENSGDDKDMDEDDGEDALENAKRKIWNLEGVVDFMCGRVDKLDYEVQALKKKLERE